MYTIFAGITPKASELYNQTVIFFLIFFFINKTWKTLYIRTLTKSNKITIKDPHYSLTLKLVGQVLHVRKKTFTSLKFH